MYKLGFKEAEEPEIKLPTFFGSQRKQKNSKKNISLCFIDYLYAEYIMRNAGLDEAQAGIKIARRNINNLIYADDTTLWQKVKKN